MQAIQRIATILRVVAKQPTGISLAELSSEVGLAKSTTLRFLQSLEVEGIIERKGNVLPARPNLDCISGFSATPSFGTGHCLSPLARAG